MSTDNAYAELGLQPGASETEVKAAWRRLASLWHPDRNPSRSAVEKMQRINEAFEVLSRAGFGSGSRAAAPGAGGGSARSPADRAAPPRSLHRKLVLNLAEAALGCTRELRGRIGGERCAGCSGAGWIVVGGRCPACAGSGAVRRTSLYNWFGAFAECEACRGGGIARRACDACAGSGRQPARPYRVTVRIPSGVRDGDRLHAGVPATAAGRPALAIDLQVRVVAHDLLQLGDDGELRCEVPVDGFAWIAEREVDVPTLGAVRPLALRRGQLTYRLPGEGFPRTRRGARGDLWVTVVPVFPDELGADREALLDRLVASGVGRDGRPRDARLRAWQRRLDSARSARHGAAGTRG